MEFSGEYLTYTEYRALGGTLDLTPFNLLEFEARRQIDKRTLNRLKNVNKIPQEVKLCEFKMINSILKHNETLTNASSNVASENTDGYSVNYITADKIADIISSKEIELNTVIEDYLFGVIINGEHIIYIGV